MSQRALLATAMFDDVVAALRASRVDQIVVAASGTRAVTHARDHGLAVLEDAPTTRSLDHALTAVAARIAPVETMLVVAADLPLLTSRDVDELLSPREAVIVAATRHGGTGGLVRRPPNCITTFYGRDSAARHLQAAADAGLTASRYDLPGFYFDVDVSDDIQQLRDWINTGGQGLGMQTRKALGVLPNMGHGAPPATVHS